MFNCNVRVINSGLEKVVIWDAEGLPLLDDGTTVFWCRFLGVSLLNVISIPQLVEKNADTLRARYLAWVHELGDLSILGRRLVEYFQFRVGLSYWWMTLFVEKCNFAKSPQIDDAIRLLAFTDWAAGRTIGCITLVSANHSLAECMRLWCEKSGVPFEWQHLPKPSIHLSWVRRIYAALPLIVQALIWLVHYLVSRWPLRGVGLHEWRKTEGRVTFVSYLFNLVPDAVKVGRYESRYWATLPGVLEKDSCKTNWLHLYVKDAAFPDAHKAAQVIRDFNNAAQGVQNHVTLDAFLSVRVVLKSLSDWGRLAWTGWRLERMISAAPEHRNLWPLFAEEWWQSTCGVTALNNTLNFRLFEAAMGSASTQQVGVYLQENQGWEFGLIQAWRAAGHGHLIGTPHSTVRFWDLRYFFDPRSYSRSGTNPLPMPDQVALNGKAATDAYLAGGYPAEHLVQVEALRYLHLNDARAPLTAGSVGSKSCLRLLVLGDYLARNTQLQMRLLELAAQALPEGRSITVKPHPAFSIIPEDYPGLRMTIVTEPIAQLLTECDVAYSSAVTSAAVDAYCAGLPVISVLDATTLNMSPLRGCVGVYYASTSDELVRALRDIISTPHAVPPEQDFFTINKELPRWRKLLLDNS
jgi:surface carbohydrate biosynthesis protein (TIGR04326 family)